MARIPGEWPTDWSGPALEPPPPPPDRSKLNLTLFAVLMVGVTVWFSLHLQPWLGEVLVVVGPLTVWALWKLLQSWLNWGGLGPRAEAGTRKLLAGPAATEPLIVALAAMGLLFFTTSSIYLVYDGSGPEEELMVSVLAEGEPFLDEPLRVTSARRTAGRPFFGRLSGEELQLVVDSPLYEPLDVRFWPGRPLRIEVPSGFETKSFHLLLLAPGIRLLNLLPAPGQTQARRFYLRIEAAGGGRLAQIDDLRQQSVLTGAPQGDLERLSAGQPDERTRAELDRYLAGSGMPAPARESFQNAWARVRAAPTPRLREHDKIKILVGCEGGEPLVEETIHVGAAGIQRQIIEVERDGC